MPKVRDRSSHLSDLERRERVAAMLARGVVRYLRDHRPESNTKEVVHKAESRLEVSARTRLHVSRG
jgi:hypothetical protein